MASAHGKCQFVVVLSLNLNSGKMIWLRLQNSRKWVVGTYLVNLVNLGNLARKSILRPV